MTTTRSDRHRSVVLVTVVFLVMLLIALMGVSSASAAPSPWWQLSQNTRPSALQDESSGILVVSVANLGDESANGESSPIEIVDKLPAGLRPLPCSGAQKPGCGVEAIAGQNKNFAGNRGPVSCPTGKPLPQTIACSFGSDPEDKPLLPYDLIEIRIAVEVVGSPSPPELENQLSVSGAGAPDATLKRALPLGGEEAFGVEGYELRPEEEGGALSTQAGSHPFQVTGSFTVKQGPQRLEKTGEVAAEPVALSKELNGVLPPGLIGNPTPLPQCTLGQFLQITGFFENQCQQQSVVGVAIVTLNELSSLGGVTTIPLPLFNIEPAVGEAARFGFYLPGTPILLDPSVRTGGDYGITLASKNISQTAALLAFKLIFWGVPGDPSHDAQRGIGCLEVARGEHNSDALPVCKAEENKAPVPLLSLPTSCNGPLQSSLEAASWVQPQNKLIFGAAPMVAMDGCNRLGFTPSVRVTPDSTAAATPTGLNVDVHVPQDSVLVAKGLAESDVRGITVKLPAGVAINPSNGDGLEACSEGLAGFEGFGEFPTEPGAVNPLFSPFVPGGTAALQGGDEAEKLLEPGVNFCANGSKIGEVTIKTPLLANPVKGFVYLASQEANPFGSVLAMYIVAEDPVSGSVIKLPGEVQLCQAAGEAIAGMTCEVVGQLVSTFENNPQLAFEDAELHFFGGERAPLASPSLCGTYTTEALFTPWSAPPGGTSSSTVRSSSSFQIDSGPNHSACTYPGQALPFNPSLTGGALNVNAGAFSPFTATMTRSSGEQNLQSLEVHLPPGLSGILTGVELCPEPQANLGECGPNSLIGETTVSVGVGGEPYTVRGGKFYLTGPYNGAGSCTVGTAGCAPFGITFEVPAKAGPFDFAKTQRNHPACDCVLVRGKIEIDPITAAITITSNPPGTPDSIPTSIEGVPLEIQHVNATTTRGNFQFTPTNCSKMAVTGTIHSSAGGADTLNVPFQVTNCAALKFEPKFTASTSGKTSKANGASLSLKVTRPSGPGTGQANFALAKIELPKQLPSRLTTLQKACTAAQFNANPAACPAASDIGYVKVATPLLPVPLQGPAYFVSHGGEAFPSVIFVLQGYGVTIDVVSTTFISKSGVTSATLKTVPDAPFTSFELTFPEKQYSALAANGNLCTDASKLTMPTEFIAQNGAKITQSTKITVTGCAKTKALTRAQKLTKALKACKKKTNKGKRATCEKTARRKYGPLETKKKGGK